MHGQLTDRGIYKVVVDEADLTHIDKNVDIDICCVARG